MGTRKVKCELYNDSMQNWKGYPIQKAQLIIADVPYNVGRNHGREAHDRDSGYQEENGSRQ